MEGKTAQGTKSMNTTGTRAHERNPNFDHPNIDHHEAIIIGGGQSGLATAYYLLRAGSTPSFWMIKTPLVGHGVTYGRP